MCFKIDTCFFLSPDLLLVAGALYVIDDSRREICTVSHTFPFSGIDPVPAEPRCQEEISAASRQHDTKMSFTGPYSRQAGPIYEDVKLSKIQPLSFPASTFTTYFMRSPSMVMSRIQKIILSAQMP